LTTIRQITEIEDLETDPHLHGGGLHAHCYRGRLDLHLDYSIHPITLKERRLNLIVYLNSEWKEDWGGELELWDHGDEGHPETLAKAIAPKHNQAILFRTSDTSYHGVPNAIAEPTAVRKSMAIYYVSPRRTNIVHRPKARFVARPGEKHCPLMEELREIRSHRRLTMDDVDKRFPGWYQSDEALPWRPSE
jgi:hypothetical protein